MSRERCSVKSKKRKSKGFWNVKRRQSTLRRALCCEGLEDRRLLAADLNVLDFTPTPSGFEVEFNQAVDTSVLNLYDAANGTFGPADLTLVGENTGPVAGSAVVEGNRLRFVATGGVLPEDTYTARLRSADDGLRALDGHSILDGEFTGIFPSGDGTPGGDFVITFEAEPEAIVVGMPDFARGPGQAVHLPHAIGSEAVESGLPIHLSDAGGVTSVLLTVNYNPDMLRITDVMLGADAPDGSQVMINAEEPGQATIAFFALDPLESGAARILSLVANVPRSAPYGEAHAVRITGLEVNAGSLAATADEAIHVAAFVGDANRNMRYDVEDARLIARVGVGLDSGLAADPPHADPATEVRALYPMVDAVIIGDVTGDGTLSALDASDLLRRAIGLPTPGIPAIPENSAPISVSLTPDTVPENVPIGTVVGTLTTEDPDEGDTHTYAFVEGEGDDDNAAFIIDGDQLLTNVELDFETKNEYHVRIVSTDSGGLSVEQMLVITVLDVNEAPTAVILTPSEVAGDAPIGTVVGTLTTEDPDEGDTHTYAFVEGEGDDDNAAFIIDGDQLLTNVELDPESQNEYRVRIMSTDSGGLSVEQMLVITVLDVNQAPTAVLLTPSEVAGDAPVGTVVGTLTTEDPDEGDTHTYAFVEGEGDDDNAAFIIDGDQLLTNVELDPETQNEYRVRIMSTDSGGLSVEQMLVITVLDVNQAPTAVMLTPSEVEENVPIGTVVGTLTTEDPDEDDTHTYAFIEGEGDDDNAAFIIDGDQLLTNVELDFETKNEYHVRIISTDSGGLSVEQMLVITVLDVNEAPTEVMLTPNSVTPSMEIGDVVGLLTTIDPDIGDTHTYELVEGEGADDNDAFEIDGDALKLATELDLSEQTSFQVRVRSTDSGGLHVEQTLVIVANQAPTAVMLTPSEVEENVPIGTVVGTLTTEDPDEDDTHTYAFIEGEGDDDNAAFIIDGDQLLTNVELDFETKNEYHVRIVSTDSGGLSVEQMLVITVLDVNEAPTDVILTPNSITPTMEIGDVVGLLTTVDPDIGDTHTYELVEGDGADDNGAFEIDGDALKLAADLDLTEQTSYTIRVRSTDSGGLHVEQTLVITVLDVNEAPTDVILTPNSITPTMEIGDVVGLLTTIDPDIGDTHTYELVEGDGADDNDAFEIDGDALKLAAELDLTEQTSYTIRVRSTDSGGLHVEQTLVIVANHAPTAVMLTPSEVEENVPIGTVVGTLTTEDPDEDDTHTYAFIEGEGDDDNAAFIIDGDQLLTNVELDYETQNEYHVRIMSTDSGGLSVEQTLVITVLDVNEAPTAVMLTPNEVAENAPIGTVVGTLTTEDPDEGDTHTYAFVDGDGGQDNAAFIIDGDQLLTNVELDHATQNQYHIRVESTDSGGLTVEESLVIVVLNVNQAPVIHLPEASQFTGIGEPLVFSAATGNAITVTDVDAGDDPVNIQLTPENGELNRTEFEGSLDDLNDWLDELIFTPDTDFIGEAFIDILANDLGHNGVGGPQTAEDRMVITVE